MKNSTRLWVWLCQAEIQVLSSALRSLLQLFQNLNQIFEKLWYSFSTSDKLSKLFITHNARTYILTQFLCLRQVSRKGRKEKILPGDLANYLGTNWPSSHNCDCAQAAVSSKLMFLFRSADQCMQNTSNYALSILLAQEQPVTFMSQVRFLVGFFYVYAILHYYK